MLTTYFGGLGDNRDTALALPVAGLHSISFAHRIRIDVISRSPEGHVLSLGIIDGRNVWRADLSGHARTA